jgi:uncharacterized damage-inducible protein DinB
MLQELSVLFVRELDTLQREIELYPSDEAVWAAMPGLPNAGGTLVLHLVGNLRHFIGGTLGASGYVRDRDTEFKDRGVPRTVLLALVADARREVILALRDLSPEQLSTRFPLAVGGRSISTSLLLQHLLAHLAYHLGQVDYHRRASTGDVASANALPLTPLGDPA